MRDWRVGRGSAGRAEEKITREVQSGRAKGKPVRGSMDSRMSCDMNWKGGPACPPRRNTLGALQSIFWKARGLAPSATLIDRRPPGFSTAAAVAM